MHNGRMRQALMVNAEGRAFLQPQEDWKRVGEGSVGRLGRVSQGLTLSCGLTNARAEVPVIGRARMLPCGGWGAGKGVRKNALRDKTKTTSANGTTRVTGP